MMFVPIAISRHGPSPPATIATRFTLFPEAPRCMSVCRVKRRSMPVRVAFRPSHLDHFAAASAASL